MNRPPSRSRAPATLADSLDEEHKELAAEALERKRTNSPLDTRNATPPPGSRFLAIGSPTMRHGSIAGIGVGVTSPTQSQSRRVLDPSDPSSWTAPHAPSKSTFPERHRSGSDSATSGYVGLSSVLQRKGPIHEEEHVSSPLPISPETDVSTRTRQGSGGAMAAALSGNFSSLQLNTVPGSSSSGRHNSTVATNTRTASPSSRIRAPVSASSSLLSPIYSTARPAPQGEEAAAPSRHRPKSDSFSSAGTDRHLSEDPASDLGESDEGEHSVSEEDESGSRVRGRQRARRKKLGTDTSESEAGDTSPEMERADTRKQIEEVQQAQRDATSDPSEPSISVISPTGERITPTTESKLKVTSSKGSDAEDEEDADIQKAKSLALNISNLDTRVQDRHVQIILRGDFHAITDEVTAGTRRARTYLACTDLSQESFYALEWTIGTLMRDGDTLLAIYAIEDENAEKATEVEREMQQEKGHQVAKEANDALNDLTKQISADGPSASVRPHTYTPATEIVSLTEHIDISKLSKKELERLKAVEQIMEAFLKLVRKTTLQVRCMIEVIHCKSPKHLILGAIDELEPNLTVVGTRGRSSLKGVLLGSFSNYLVTKSSVPVMVARRKLKVHAKRLNANKVRLTNNLVATVPPRGRRSLTHARID